MSQWTHVIGTIQCGLISDEKIVQALGTPWSFGEAWNGTIKNKKFVGPKVPDGSEGSVQYRVTRHSENEEYTVFGEGTLIAIEGDLRNYGGNMNDIKELVDWFINGCMGLPARLGILSIGVESGPQYTVRWDWDLKSSTIQQIVPKDFETEYKALFGEE